MAFRSRIMFALAAVFSASYSLSPTWSGDPGPPTFKYSAKHGLPILYPYHGTLLNHDLQEISPTDENIQAVLKAYVEAVAKTVPDAPSIKAQGAKAIQGFSADADVLLELNSADRLVAAAKKRVGDPERDYMLDVLKAWAFGASSRQAKDLATKGAVVTDLIEATAPPTPSTGGTAPSYIEQCRAAKVPIPPDWGSPEWKFQGVLSPNFTFSGGADGPTEVWAASNSGVAGACMALPRIDKTSGDIKLLGIICQSAETGSACFWDNVDKATGDRLDGGATKTMKIESIGDATMLAENCTDCHRGANVFVIHPGTALDIGNAFELKAKVRYQPISGRPQWGNPAPLIPEGTPPCGSCHEIPQLRSNNDSPDSALTFCAILRKAADMTMPVIGNPARWDNPRPAYKAHIELLRSNCAEEIADAPP